MSLFGAAHGLGGGLKGPTPYINVLHMFRNDETLHNYTLTKVDSKIYKSCDAPLEFC